MSNFITDFNSMDENFGANFGEYIQQDLSNYYTKPETDAAIANHHDDTKSDKTSTYTKTETENVIAAATSGMATQTWVGQQGYITKNVNDLTNYRTASGQDSIDNALGGRISVLETKGHYLTDWNCATGMPVSLANPYTYKAGDSFIVGATSATLTYRHEIVLDGQTLSDITASADVVIHKNSSAELSFADVKSWLYSNGYNTQENSYPATGTISTLQHDYQIIGVFASTSQIKIIGSNNVAYAYSSSTMDVTSDTVTQNTINYRPSGASYSGTASTVVETSNVNIGDTYFYNGSTWILQHNNETYTKSEIDTTVGTLQPKTDNLLSTVSKQIVGAINEVDSIAKGATQAVSYGNISTMVTALNAMTSTQYRTGQNIYIVTLNVPDLWISSVEQSSVPYTYVDDATFVNALTTNGYVQVGYYKLSAMETQKVDLTNYYTKSQTYSKSEVDTADATKVDKLTTTGEKVYAHDGATQKEIPTVSSQGIPIATSISSSSTHNEVVSAKAVYDFVMSLMG